jgi:hypothetical protein
MKYKFFSIFLLAIIILNNPIKSNTDTDTNANANTNQEVEGTCHASDTTCSQRANAKLKEDTNQNPNQNKNNDLEVEEISKENPKENIKSEAEIEALKKQAEEDAKKKYNINDPKSKKSGKPKENEPEPDLTKYPEDFMYKELFQKYGERKRYLHSFTLKSNYTEYYDFNLDDEEIWTLQNDRITIFPPKRFEKNFQGNFLHFYKVVYEKKMPVYLTTDSMLYAFNENLKVFENTFYEDILPNYLYTFLVNIIKYTNDLMDTPEGEEHKYFISHTQLYFATALELLQGAGTHETAKEKKASEAKIGAKTSGNKETGDKKYMQVIESQVKSFITKIKSLKTEEFFMFYNKLSLDCGVFLPNAFFERNKILRGVFQAIKWFQSTRFLFDIDFPTPIWYLGKMIVDSGNMELYKLIYSSLKYVMGQDSKTLSIPDIYNLGVTEFGLKDVFELDKKQAESLFRKVISLKKNFDLPYLNDNFLYTNEEAEAIKMEREFSSGIFDQFYDTEDWVKNKLLIYEKSRLRTVMYSYEIPLAIHQTVLFKNYIYAKYQGYTDKETDPIMPLRDGIDLRKVMEGTRYSIKDLLVFSPEKFRLCIKNGIHLLLYKASRRIKSSDPVFDKDYYRQKNFNIAYAGYVDYKRDFAILIHKPEVKKKEGGFADVVVEPNTEFYNEMLELTKNYRKVFDDLQKFGIEKMGIKKDPIFSTLNYHYSVLKGYFTHLEDCIKMLLMVIKKQENGVELDSELKETLFNIIKYEQKYNTWTGWYVKLLNPNDHSNIFNFYSWSTRTVIAESNFDLKFNGCLIYVNTHFPLIGLIVKEDKLTQKRKLLLYSSFHMKETIKLYDLKNLNFDDEMERVSKRE